MQWHIHGLLREHRFLRCKNRSDVGFWGEAPEKSHKFLEIITSSRKILVKRKNQQRCIKRTEGASYK